METTIITIKNDEDHQNDMGSDLLPNPHPGVLLKEDFLDEMGITPYRLAKSIGKTPAQVSKLLKGRRSITPITALLLGRFFGTSPDYWLNIQSRYDMIEARRSIGDRLERVQPYEAVTVG